jgi:hypothetical protein
MIDAKRMLKEERILALLDEAENSGPRTAIRCIVEVLRLTRERT